MKSLFSDIAHPFLLNCVLCLFPQKFSFNTKKKMTCQLVYKKEAVVQSFREFGTINNDDAIITSMQSEMLPYAIFTLLKPAVLHCVHNNRQYLNKNDLEFGRMFCDWPYFVLYGSKSLLDPKEVYYAVSEHLKLIADICVRHKIASTVDVKISKDVLALLQYEIECNIRGFIKYMQNLCSSSKFGCRVFHDTLSSILKDDYYLKYENTFGVY